MSEVLCICGDSEAICAELASKLSQGWTVLNMQTSLYESTGGLRRDTTIYLLKESA